MKTQLGKVILFLTIGVIFMLNNYGCSGGLTYARYDSKDPELGVAMDYISGWIFREYQGPDKSFVTALFFEDKKGDQFKAKVAFTVIKSSKTVVNPTLESVVKDTIDKRLSFRDAKLLSKAKNKIAGSEAQNMLFSYRVTDKLYSTDAKLIPVTERIIIFKRNDKFYTLRYENREEDFDKLGRAFSHMIKSIKFKDNK